MVEYLAIESKAGSMVRADQEPEGVVSNLLNDYPNYPSIYISMNRNKLIQKTKERILKLHKEHSHKVGLILLRPQTNPTMW